jgi:serine phosphatase RsbU (regulator of sigma subunit)
MDIGGDWYDAIPIGDEVALIVGDVEGHNVYAAATVGDPRSGVVRIVRAGHCPPLLRLPDGHAEILDAPCGPLLGVEAMPDYPESERHLVPGSVLTLYTDGLIERRDSDIGSGIDRLRDSLARMGGDRLEDLADGLLRDACRSLDRADDIALLLTEYTPSP